MHRLGWVRKQIYVETAVQGKAEKRRKWLYCRAPTQEELEMDARQLELSAAEQAGKPNNVTTMARHTPDVSNVPVMKETPAPQA
jgi:hypothetical protein